MKNKNIRATSNLAMLEFRVALPGNVGYQRAEIVEKRMSNIIAISRV